MTNNMQERNLCFGFFCLEEDKGTIALNYEVAIRVNKSEILKKLKTVQTLGRISQVHYFHIFTKV